MPYQNENESSLWYIALQIVVGVLTGWLFAVLVMGVEL